MKQIYLLMSSVDYEGSAPVLAFNNEPDAKSWEEKAGKWLSRKPALLAETQEEWDRYDNEYEQWSKEIPELSDYTISDGFHIASIELKP